MKIPEKGSVEWIPLSPYDDTFKGMEVGIIHQGPKHARTWGYMYKREQIAEAKRLADIRKGYTQETAPTLFGEDFISAEGVEEANRITETIFREGVAGIRKAPFPEDDKSAALAMLEYLSIAAQLRLAREIIARQSLSREQFPPPTNSSDLGPLPVATA